MSVIRQIKTLFNSLTPKCVVEMKVQTSFLERLVPCLLYLYSPGGATQGPAALLLAVVFKRKRSL